MNSDVVKIVQDTPFLQDRAHVQTKDSMTVDAGIRPRRHCHDLPLRVGIHIVIESLVHPLPQDQEPHPGALAVQ